MTKKEKIIYLVKFMLALAICNTIVAVAIGIVCFKFLGQQP